MKDLRRMLVILLALTADGRTADVTVRINVANLSEFKLDGQLFGSFFEEHWGDVTPGIFEQYLVNPSFEPWFHKQGDTKTRLVFEPYPRDGVAYPWEPIPGGDAKLTISAEERVNSQQSQRITVTGGFTGGVLQQLALPDYRTKKYRLRLHLRGEGDVRASAVLFDGAAGPRVLQTVPLELTMEWKAIEVEMDLGENLTQRHLSRFGIVRLAIQVEGEGSLFVDQATLYPSDTVEGLYNPETLANIRSFAPTAIRWPGGNYASGYYWRDGIGPIDKRPTRPNRAWGASTKITLELTNGSGSRNWQASNQ